MKRFPIALFALLVLASSNRAMACDPGPYPIIFEGASTQLSEPSKRLLNSIGENYSSPGMRQMLKWYGSEADSVQQARVGAVVAYLRKRGVYPPRLIVVHVNTKPRTFTFRQVQVQATVSIETIRGCGS